MLKLEGVSLSYGSFRALDNVSLHAGKGELVVLLGANGAGKSTLLKIAAGTIRPTQGRVGLQGRVTALLELGAGFAYLGRRLDANVCLVGSGFIADW